MNLRQIVCEQGRRLLRDLSGPHTTDPAAHAAVAAAWEELDLGAEAVAAYRRVPEDERADARRRVGASARPARRREARGTARQILRAVLREARAPVGVRIDAAEHLPALREEAEAHLGLLRPAREDAPGEAERQRIADLLPDDCAPRPGRIGPREAESRHPVERVRPLDVWRPAGHSVCCAPTTRR
ncbi:hypothetical protein AB0E88_23560 [Streptomyces sp. NPDC028635]|uniref:hypothetical protein n=1 Tax=Streptomyces sp. NPDC028635 TaxID=3154800 RepID=UPI0033F107CF